MKIALILFILLIFISIYFKYNYEGFTNNESDNIVTNNNKDIYMVRIIGNCLPDINDPNQNYSNLKYILENEEEYPNIKKVWVLNRIVDKNMEDKYIKLLKQNNKHYETIPFNKKYFFYNAC